MEPTAIGARLASAAIGPLVKKLFVAEGSGAGIADKPIRISGYVSFKGEKRSLGDADLRKLAGKIVEQALRNGERPLAADEERAVTEALASTLHALGDLTLTDLDAVRLGAHAFARELRRAGGDPERHLTADATYCYERLLDAACLHILHFFTQRSTFVAHTQVEQTRVLGELTAKVDELIRRDPLPGAEDAAFEQVYLPYVARKHGKLTIYGIDLHDSPARWPLDAAYLSLEAAPVGRWSWSTRMKLERTFHREASEDRLCLALPDAPSVTRHLTPEWVWAAALRSEEENGLSLESRIHAAFDRSLHWTPAPQPADQALARSPRVLLRGEAGSGKTTLVQWLAVTAACPDLAAEMAYLEDRVPFVLPLRTLTRHGERLPAPKDFLAATGCPLDGTQPDGWVNRVLAAGRGLILIDGIDEVPEPERERARRWLRELSETYAGDNRWLVTSRPSAVGENWLDEDEFTELTLSPMTPAGVATFIKRWHSAARADEDADLGTYQTQLLHAVRTRPDLGRLATNPLMCGLICALHRDRRGYLPHGRKDLYEAAFSMLLSRRDRERDMVGPELREEPQLDLLQRLAYWLIKNGRTEMDRSRAEGLIGRALSSVPEVAALGDAAAVLDHFLDRSGLLREPTAGTVDFIHRTFQDYLGARAAVEEGDFGLLTRNGDDDQWEDVIRMAVALARPRERVTILQDLMTLGDNSSDPRTRSRVYLLAAACLEHATTLDNEVREAVEQRMSTLIPPRGDEEARALAEVGPLVLGLLPGPAELRDAEEAFNVVAAASLIKSEAAVPFLSQFATHSAREVRSHLLGSWSRFDATEYADEVIAHLDPTDLCYVVHSDEQLRQLERLGVRAEELRVQEGVSEAALASYGDRIPFRVLTLSKTTTTGLDFLAGHTELRSLRLRNCPALVNVSAIGELPIRSLSIIGGAHDIDLRPIARLADLTDLEIALPGNGIRSTALLPSEAPLRTLRVWGALNLDGLGSLRARTHLEELELIASPGPDSAGEWQEIQGLPSLRSLRLAAASLEALPPSMTLANVTSLHLDDGGDGAVQAAIRRLSEVFPGVRSCSLLGEMTAEGTFDLAPLARCPELRSVFIAATEDRIRNADKLPSSVLLHHP